MKYRYIKDNYTEGWGMGEDHETVHEAVQDALKNCYGNPFLIVAVIDWEATEKK